MRAIDTIARPHRGHGALLQVVSPTRTTRMPCNSSSLRVVMSGMESSLRDSPCGRTACVC